MKVVTEEAIHPCPFQLQEKQKYDRLYQLQVSKFTDSDYVPVSASHQQPALPTSVIAVVSIIGTPIITPELFDMSKFVNSYPHRRGCRLGQR